MPAVKTFALYAALAVLMDFILQMTAFVALLSLDARRQDDNRCELVCCVQVSKPRPKKPHEGLLLPLMRKFYAPALLNRFVRIFVVNAVFKVERRHQKTNAEVNVAKLNSVACSLPRWCFLSSCSAQRCSLCCT